LERVIALIDGFNLYHSINSNQNLRKYKWLDLRKLSECFLKKSSESLSKVFYFSAYAFWNPEKENRHRVYVRALRSRGVEAVMSSFKVKMRKCRKCNRWYKTYEEKETDIRIVTTLFEYSIQNDYDTAVVVSGDTDLVPGLSFVKRIFPKKKIRSVFPFMRSSMSLKNMADEFVRIKEKHLASSQLPDVIDLGEGKLLRRPDKWS